MSIGIADFSDKIFRSRCVMLLTLKRQGYDTSAYENCSVSNVDSMLRTLGQIDMLVERMVEQSDLSSSPPPKERAYVWYCLDTRQAVKNTALLSKVAGLQDRYDFGPHDMVYIVGNSDAKDTLISTIHDLWITQSIFIAITTVARTQFDIFAVKHVFKHTKISPEEKARIEQLYNIRVDGRQWPEISRYCPCATAIALRPGEVCKIDRPSGPYYRICVSDVARKSSARK